MKQEVIAGFLEAMPLPSVLVDQTERFIGANRLGHELLGDQIMGRHFATILRQPSVAGAIEKCLEDRGNRATRYLSNDGAQDTTYEVSLRYIAGIGAVEGGAVLISFTDVTEREQANQMRRDFVANVSHELKTPLASLMGFIETLKGPAKDDPDAQQKFLKIMQDQSERMSRLVSDLLSLSKIELLEHTPPTSVTDLSEAMTTIIEGLHTQIESKNITVRRDMDDVIPVLGDTEALTQVFQNLLENAVKYGHQGTTVTIRCKSYGPGSQGMRRLGRPSVAISIIDQGDGIPREHIPRLTERFYRVDAARSRELGGTGLGLAIVKHIVNRHRGVLTIDSEVGRGSTFTVYLPQAAITEDHPKPIDVTEVNF